MDNFIGPFELRTSDCVTPVVLRELVRIEKEQVIPIMDSFFLLNQTQAANITQHEMSPSSYDKTILDAVIVALDKYNLRWILDGLDEYCREFLLSIGAKNYGFAWYIPKGKYSVPDSSLLSAILREGYDLSGCGPRLEETGMGETGGHD